jgi:hypothetical protein
MKKSLLPLLLLIFTACQKENTEPQKAITASKPQEEITASKPQKAYFRATINGVPFSASFVGASQAGAFSFRALTVYGIDSTQVGQDGEPLQLAITMEGYYNIVPVVSFTLSHGLSSGVYRSDGVLHYSASGQAEITKYHKKTRKGGMVTGTFQFVTDGGDNIANGEFSVLAPEFRPLVPPEQNP